MYKEESDKYYIFLVECTEESDKHIANTTLYDAFNIWHRKKYPAERIPNNKLFVNGMRKHKTVKNGVKINGKTYNGIEHLRLKVYDDED